MIRLATLGGLTLTDGEASDVALPRRRLALLALLAAANDRGLTRDKLVAYLWPESSSEDARHSLEQLLYSLRRQLGPRVLSGIDPLRLNPDVISSDLTTFVAALERRADDDAVAAYSGQFLDGFYLKGADEFERWVEEERARLSAEYAHALERTAERASRQNNWPAAIQAWRRLLALDRLSARNALGLIRALADAGDRPEALRVAASYQTLVRDDLGIPLETSIAAFVESLRNGNGEIHRLATEHGHDRRSAATSPTHVAPLTLAASEVTERAWRPPFFRVRRPRAVTMLAVLTGVFAVSWAKHAASVRAPVSGRQLIAVTVFENHTGDSTLDKVGTMMAYYTRIALAATGLFDVRDPSFDVWQPENARPVNRMSEAALRKTDATIVVRAAYYKEGDSLRFMGEGVEVETRRVIFAFDSVWASRAALADAAERLRQRVMSAIATHVDSALTPWAGNKGAPPVRFNAYQQFADGMTDFVSAIVEQIRGNTEGEVRLFNSARDHLTQAVQLDSTYSIAALWLFWSRYNVGDHAGADSVLNALKRRDAPMSQYERLLYRYNYALLHGTPEDRYQADIGLVRSAPTSEFRFCLIRDALESNHPDVALKELSSLDDGYSWMRFMPPPSGFRVRALVEQREYRRAVQAARTIHDNSPDDLTPAYAEIDALAALGRIDEIEPVVRRFQRPTGSGGQNSANLALYAGLRLQSAGRSDRAKILLRQALDTYKARIDNHNASDADRFGQAQSLYYLEQWDSARAAFERIAAAPIGRLRYDKRALLFLGALAQRRRDSNEVSRLRSLLDSAYTNPALLSYFDARVAAVRGDNRTALTSLTKAVSLGAQAEEMVTEGAPAPSIEADFAALGALSGVRQGPHPTIARFWTRIERILSRR